MRFKFKISYCLLIAGLSFSSVSSWADSALPQQSSSVTLSELMQHVYKRLPEKLGESVYQQEAKANKGLASSMFAKPSTLDLSHYNDAVASGDGLQEWEGTYNMPLWLPGQKQKQQELTDKINAQLPAYQKKLKLMASAQARSLLWSVMQAETMVKQAQYAWDTAKKLEKDVDSRVKAGEIPATERILAQTNTLDMHSKLVDAQSKLQQAVSNYEFYTGLKQLPQQPEETLAKQQQINKTHPYLAMWTQQIDKLRSEMGLAHYQNAVNPDLYVGMRSQRGTSSEGFNNSVHIGISFALDDKAYRAPAVARASKALTDAQIGYRQTERQLKSQLLMKQDELKSRQQQLQLAIEQDKANQHYYALQKRAFDLGEINLVDLLRTQAAPMKAGCENNHCRSQSSKPLPK